MISRLRCITVQSLKMLTAFTVCCATFAACSINNEFDESTLTPISGSAKTEDAANKPATATDGTLSVLTLHYSENVNSSIKTREVSNTSGKNTSIAFTTSGNSPLFWQHIIEGSNTTPQPFYLTANRQSGALSEPLWAKTESTGTRAALEFGEMQCRLSKFTVKLTASVAINPSKLSVYMNAYPVAADDITKLATPVQTTAEQVVFIAKAASGAYRTNFTSAPILIGDQAIDDNNKTLTVWYDKNNNNADDTDELYTIDLSTVAVTRPESDTNTTFAFTANEHITLNIQFAFGLPLGLTSVEVVDWTQGTNWDDEGGDYVPAR